MIIFSRIIGSENNNLSSKVIIFTLSLIFKINLLTKLLIYVNKFTLLFLLLICHKAEYPPTDDCDFVVCLFF